MQKDEQIPPRMGRWLGWALLLELFSMVALWIAFILVHIPGQVVPPSWVVTALTALGLALFVVSTGGLFVAYRYLRRRIRRQQGR